jgi:cytochrome P450
VFRKGLTFNPFLTVLFYSEENQIEDGAMKLPPLVEDSTLTIIRGFLGDNVSYQAKLYKKYGDFYRLKILNKIYYSSFHPDYMKHILLDNVHNYKKPTKGPFSHEAFVKYCGNTNNLRHTDNMEYWKKSGKAVTPAFFSEERFREYTPQISKLATEMADKWESNSEINIKSELLELSTRCILSTLFDDVHIDIEKFHHDKERVFAQVQKRGVVPSKFHWILSSQDKKDWTEGKDAMERTIQKLIQDRLVSGKECNDILGGLIKAFKDELDSETFLANLNSELRMYLVTGNTMASTINSSFAILSQYPEVEKKLLDELKGKRITYENLSKFTYLNCFISEVLRFRSPAPFLVREAKEEDEIMGYHIPKGTLLFMPVYWTNRHPDFWKNPEGFDPERFRDKPWGQDHEYAYLPFMGGPRICIGKKYALLQIAAVLATLLPRYRFSLLPGSSLVSTGLVVPFPASASIMKVEKR